MSASKKRFQAQKAPRWLGTKAWPKLPRALGMDARLKLAPEQKTNASQKLPRGLGLGLAIAWVVFRAATVAALLLFLLSACQSLKRAAAPVAVFGARVVERQPQDCAANCLQGQDAGGLDKKRLQDQKSGGASEKRLQAQDAGGASDNLWQDQDAGGGACLGVEFTAVNLSGRPLKSVLFRASVAQSSDESGEGESFGDAFWEASLLLESDGPCPGAESVLESGGEARVFIPLEEFCAGDGDGADDLEIQSLRVERAAYEDGEVWERQ